MIATNIPKALSDSVIPRRTNQMYQPNQQTSLVSGQRLPPMHENPMNFLSSSIWQTSQQQQQPSTNNLIHSQSDNSENFRYQLPQFGGINKPAQPTLPNPDSQIPNASGTDSRRLQFQHPYPENEVRTEMKITPSDATSNNRSSPMYHRLFSMDPTWSVTPGSLPPTNSDNAKPLQSNFSNDRSKK